MLNLGSAVDRGAIAQLIGSPALAQKPQLTHRVSPRFCTSAFDLEKAVSYQPRRGGVAGHGLTQIRLFSLQVNATSRVVAT